MSGIPWYINPFAYLGFGSLSASDWSHWCKAQGRLLQAVPEEVCTMLTMHPELFRFIVLLAVSPCDALQERMTWFHECDVQKSGHLEAEGREALNMKIRKHFPRLGRDISGKTLLQYAIQYAKSLSGKKKVCTKPTSWCIVVKVFVHPGQMPLY